MIPASLRLAIAEVLEADPVECLGCGDRVTSPGSWCLLCWPQEARTRCPCGAEKPPDRTLCEECYTAECDPRECRHGESND